MNEVYVEALKQAPSLAILAFVVWQFLTFLSRQEDKRYTHEKELEAERSNNERSIEDSRQKYNSETNSMWASHVRTLTESTERLAKTIAEALSDHEKASQERYEKMGITKDLLDAALARERERRKS